MAEELLDNLGVLPLPEEERSGGVAEVMEADVRQFGLFEQGLEGAAVDVGHG